MFNKNENRIKFSVFVVGFTTIITQIILLRNFLAVFSGIELILGIILSNWMLITAIGSYFGRFYRKKELDFRILFFSHILLGILPLILAFLIIYLRNIIVPPGKMINLIQVYVGSFILLLPFCLISGFLFSVFSSYYSSEKGSNQIYKIYGIEAMGAIAGGLLFNFAFIFLFTTFFTLKFLLILNFSTALFLYFITKRGKMPWVLGIGAIVIAGIVSTFDFESLAWGEFFKKQEIIEHIETPFGNLSVTESSNQINFYENGILLFASDNVIANEENVHYAMLQHHDPEDILLISGGISGTIREVLKYNITSIDYLEIDPQLIRLADKHLSSLPHDDRINIVNKDARLHLKQSNKKYDVVLINLPDPVNSQINRFYTLEFFEEIKQNLSSTGVISISLSGSANYMNKESIQLHTALYSTMKLVFSNVIIIPGQRNFFIGADSPISARIANLSKNRMISNQYVNQFYLDDLLIIERKNKIEDEIKLNAIINNDFYPAVYLIQMKLWLSKFNGHFIVFGIIALLIVIAAARMQIVNYALFATGFSATSLELLLLIAFQVIYGYMYYMMGVFITLFMIGLVIGAMYIKRKIKASYKNFSIIQYLLGILAILAPVFLITINTGNTYSFIVHTVFIFLFIMTGVITGLQFSIGTNLRAISIESNASGSYGSDSLGSAFGALTAASLLIPLFGLIKVCLIVGIINFITGLVILIRKGNKS